MADSNLSALRYVEESTWGTTPASALQTLRFTSESLNDEERTVQSSEILSDRQLSDLIRTYRGGGGGFDFELSYGTYDDFFAAALADDWTSDVLENGTTKKSFTLEKQFQVDGSPADHYFTYPGMRLDTLSLAFQLESIVTGSFGFMGKAPTNATTTAGTGGPTAATTSEVMSVIDISTITVGGSSPGDVTSLTLDVTNNLRMQQALSSADPVGIGYGGFRASGQITIYFANADLYDAYEAETSQEIIVTIADSGSSSYTFTIPVARLSAPQINAGGQDQDVEATFNWTALKDSGSTEKMLLISRSA